MNGLIAKTKIFDTAIAAGAFFLSSDITPTEGRSALRITVAFDTATKFKIAYHDGVTTLLMTMNNDTELAASTIYTFTVGSDSTLGVNFQHTDAGSINCDLLIVSEVMGGVV